MDDIAFEQEYSIGRPNKKKARIDIIVYKPHSSDIFLFIELKLVTIICRKDTSKKWNIKVIMKKVFHDLKYVAKMLAVIRIFIIFAALLLTDYEKDDCFIGGDAAHRGRFRLG